MPVGGKSLQSWIPRSGNDSHGKPYVWVTCRECLRVFQLEVVEETTGQVLEVSCRFCPSTNQYTIQPSGQDLHEVCA